VKEVPPSDNVRLFIFSLISDTDRAQDGMEARNLCSSAREILGIKGVALLEISDLVMGLRVYSVALRPRP